MVTGQAFGIVMTGIGVITLAGVVVNNNIVLIDTYDRLRETGMPAIEAVVRTGAQRLRPVMLTAVTTVLGLMPMVLGLNIDLFTREITIGGPSDPVVGPTGNRRRQRAGICNGPHSGGYAVATRVRSQCEHMDPTTACAMARPARPARPCHRSRSGGVADNGLRSIGMQRRPKCCGAGVGLRPDPAPSLSQCLRKLAL